MFEDARKTSGHEGDFEIKDLAELVAEAIELKSIDLKQLPPLIDRITEVAAKQVAEKVMQRLADNPELARQLAAAPQTDAPQIAAPSTGAAIAAKHTMPHTMRSLRNLVRCGARTLSTG